MIRTLIVDDESLARSRMVRMVGRIGDCDVVAEADSGAAAVASVEAHHPDLLLLDIQLGDMDGFSVIRLLAEPVPAVIFVTAHNQHAVAAFETDALDYVLKPVRQARLEQAISRVRRGTANRSLDRIVDARPGVPRLKRLPVRKGERILLIPLADIRSAIVDRGLVFVTTQDESFATKYTTLQDVEDAIEPGILRRVHRQALVNLEHVREILTADNATARLRLSGGAEVPVSRSQLPTVRRLLRL